METLQRPFTDIAPAERRRRRFPNVGLISHTGQALRFYDDLLKDKTVLLNVMYTHCTDTCPTATATLAGVQQILGSRVGRDIFMYSLTIDPGHDTPPVLAEYARRFGVQPGWSFLTGRKHDLEAVRKALGFVADPARDGGSTHVGMVKFGIEPLERWAGCPIFSRPETIARAVLRLEPQRARRAAG
jgi:protein SCO1/2